MAKMETIESTGCHAAKYYMEDGVKILIDDEGSLVKPKRSLTACNFFFREQRRQMLQEQEYLWEQKNNESEEISSAPRIGFSAMAREVSARWKLISEIQRQVYLDLAAKDKIRYTAEITVWRKLEKEAKKKNRKRKHRESADAPVSKKKDKKPTFDPKDTTVQRVPLEEKAKYKGVKILLKEDENKNHHSPEEELAGGSMFVSSKVKDLTTGTAVKSPEKTTPRSKQEQNFPVETPLSSSSCTTSSLQEMWFPRMPSMRSPHRCSTNGLFPIATGSRETSI